MYKKFHITNDKIYEFVLVGTFAFFALLLLIFDILIAVGGPIGI